MAFCMYCTSCHCAGMEKKKYWKYDLHTYQPDAWMAFHACLYIKLLSE